MSDDNVVSIYKRGKFRVARERGTVAQAGGIVSGAGSRNPNDMRAALDKLAANVPGKPIGSGGFAGKD